MTSITFKGKILQFDKHGEKTGWSYVELSQSQAEKINPGVRKSFRVKGTLDNHAISKTSLLPMGNGKFILPMNASMRKGTGKKAGDMITVKISIDAEPLKLNSEFVRCLKDEPTAHAFFLTLAKSHQHYFSKWIDSAKTRETKVKRITRAVIALAQRQGYPEMIRANRAQ